MPHQGTHAVVASMLDLWPPVEIERVYEIETATEAAIGSMAPPDLVVDHATSVSLGWFAGPELSDGVLWVKVGWTRDGRPGEVSATARRYRDGKTRIGPAHLAPGLLAWLRELAPPHPHR